MSGEAGTSYLSRYYHLSYTGGMNISIAERPSGDGQDTARYFAAKEAEFRRRLAPQVPAISAAIEQARAELPIADYLGDAGQVHEAIIDDRGAVDTKAIRAGAQWFAKGPAQRALIQCPVEHPGRGFERADLSLVVSAPVRRSELARLGEAVARVLWPPVAAESGEGLGNLWPAEPVERRSPLFTCSFNPGSGWVDALHLDAVSAIHETQVQRAEAAIAKALAGSRPADAERFRLHPLPTAEQPSLLRGEPVTITVPTRGGGLTVMLAVESGSLAAATDVIRRLVFQAVNS